MMQGSSVTTDFNILVEEYKTPEHSVFGVYKGGRHWQRFTPTEGHRGPFWTERKPDGHDRAVSEVRARSLEEVWENRNDFREVRRFPRTIQEQPGGWAWDKVPQFDPARLNSKTVWLVRSFLAAGTIQLVHGERGSFKSTLFLRFAHAVSQGKKFLGMKIRRSRVLYLDYENPPSVIKQRCEDFHIDLPNDSLKIWDRFENGFIPKPGDDLLQDLVRRCEETGERLWIVFDSWSSLLRSGEGGENTGQVAPVLAELRRLADLGATITVLDHTRKYDPAVLYGSQDKEAKADTIHNLQMFRNHAEPNSPIIRVDSWLKRFAPKGATNFSFRAETFQDDTGEWHITSLKLSDDPLEADRKRKIEGLKLLIRDFPGFAQNALLEQGVRRGIDSRDKIVKMLKAGVGKHWIVRRAAHNKSRYELL
jgi:archaellum biogenesis ATPase FlaH